MSFGKDDVISPDDAVSAIKDGILKASWKGMEVSAPVKPEKQPKNINDHA